MAFEAEGDPMSCSRRPLTETTDSLASGPCPSITGHRSRSARRLRGPVGVGLPVAGVCPAHGLSRLPGQRPGFTPHFGVGSTEHGIYSGDGEADHPHGRGEHQQLSPKATNARDHPTGVGSTVVVVVVMVILRITPTGVGSTAADLRRGRGIGSPPRAWGASGLRQPRLGRTDHPHGRGEHWPVCAAGRVAEHPHGRGEHATPMTRRNAPRITPTGVGSTQASGAPHAGERITPTGVGSTLRDLR